MINSEQKKRLEWLDIAKGMAIILMVLGHTSIPSSISNFIWAFHMPLFFIASGFTTNWERYKVGYFAIHKAKTILLPFLIYSVILLLLSQASSERVLLSDFLKQGWISWALWFIPVLYCATILARLVFLVCNKYMRIIIVLAYLAVAGIFSYYKIQLPWSLSTVPIAIVFVFVGIVLRKKSQIQSLSQKRVIILATMTFVITTLISHYWRLDLCFNKILPLAPLLISAITGTIMIFAISNLIERNSYHLSILLKSIGRETFVIVAFSQIVIVLLNDYFALNALIKYAILSIILTSIVYAKNIIKQTLLKE